MAKAIPRSSGKSQAASAPTTHSDVGAPLDRQDQVGRPVRTVRDHGKSGRRTTGSKLAFSTDSDRALTLVAQSGRLNFDIETAGLHPHSRPDAAVGAIIVKTGGERFIFREYPEWWDEVLADKDTEKIGSNLSFDLMWNAQATGIPKVRNVKDLMIESQITHRYRTFAGVGKAFPNLRSPKATIESGFWQGNDLASIIYDTLGERLKKGNKDAEDRIYHEDVWEYETSWEKYEDEDGKTRRRQVKTPVKLLHKGVDWTGTWSDDMIEYMLEDIDFLEPAHEELEKRILKEGQERVAWIENSAVFPTAWMKYNGVGVNVPAWKEHLKEQKKIAGHLHERHLTTYFPEVQNFRSNPQVCKGMSEYIGAPIRSVAKDVITGLAPLYPGAKVFQDWQAVNTRIKMWGPKFLEDFVCKICGRFHPDWRQIGAETMRYSCANPNLQQIPRDADYRKLFVAKPGYLLASLDYSGIEVVVAAVFAQCHALLEACRTGNPHGAKAAATMQITYEDWLKLDEKVKRTTRQAAKIVNFGMLFGGGAIGLMKQAQSLFNVHLSEAQAQEMIYDHYQSFPELKLSRNWAYQAMDRPGTVEVRNLVGMRRILEGWNRKPTSWLNTIIQSSAGHGIKSSFRYLMEAGLLPYLCLQVHDEFVFEFPEKKARKYAKLAHNCMIRGMQEVLGLEAPIIVEWEGTIGRTWLKG